MFIDYCLLFIVFVVITFVIVALIWSSLHYSSSVCCITVFWLIALYYALDVWIPIFYYLSSVYHIIILFIALCIALLIVVFAYVYVWLSPVLWSLLFTVVWLLFICILSLTWQSFLIFTLCDMFVDYWHHFAVASLNLSLSTHVIKQKLLSRPNDCQQLLLHILKYTNAGSATSSYMHYPSSTLRTI